MRTLSKIVACLGIIAAMQLAIAAEPTAEDVTVAMGLSGTLLKPAGVERPPAVLLIAGSGPTDRDGNQGGAGPGELRQLAETLAQHGIASLRYDKRGVGRSAAAGLGGPDLLLDTFVADANAWLAYMGHRPDLGTPVVAGHGDGGLIAILIAEGMRAAGVRGRLDRQLDRLVAKPMPAAGMVLLATPGRPLGDVLRDRLRRSGMPAALLNEALATLATLEKGRTVPAVRPELSALFRPSVQPFLRSVLAVDPARELRHLTLPVMIVSGGHDLQVGSADAARLAAARPDAAAARRGRHEPRAEDRAGRIGRASSRPMRIRSCRSRRAWARRSPISCGASPTETRAG